MANDTIERPKQGQATGSAPKSADLMGDKLKAAGWIPLDPDNCLDPGSLWEDGNKPLIDEERKEKKFALNDAGQLEQVIQKNGQGGSFPVEQVVLVSARHPVTRREAINHMIAHERQQIADERQKTRQEEFRKKLAEEREERDRVRALNRGRRP